MNCSYVPAKLVIAFGALLTATLLAMACTGGKAAELQESSESRYVNPVPPVVTLPTYQGNRYLVQVPDTLDLAERARLAVHGLTSCVDPQADYECYFFVRMHGNRPIMEHAVDDDCQTSMHTLLPSMRLMSGSLENMHVEQRWLEVVLQQQGPDGLMYCPVKGRPWIRPAGMGQQSTGQFDEFKGDQYTGPLNNSSSLWLLVSYYRLTGSEIFKDAGRRLVDGMAEQAVRRGGMAFYPKGLYGLGEKSDPSAPYPPPEKNAILGSVIGSLQAYHAATGYLPAKTLADEFAAFLRSHGKLVDADGRWEGTRRHLVFNASVVSAALGTALANGDQESIEWCRKSFEIGKAASCGEMLTGWFPEYAQPAGMTGEACAVCFMIDLALNFSTAGVADYWDDVDRWVRNHFAECQLTDSKWMYTKFADQPAKPFDSVVATDDAVGERSLGCFSSWPAFNDYFGREGHADPYRQIFMHCCLISGCGTLHHVWNNILTPDAERLKVNLLLNRASPWADVDSYIPYEGRIDVRLKRQTDLSIRIPSWVKPQETRCEVNGCRRELSWEGRYARVGKVAPNDTVTLSFPILERSTPVEVQGKKYTLLRKGNEVVGIDPPGKYSPLYQRDHYRQNTARRKEVERFIAGSK